MHAWPPSTKPHSSHRVGDDEDENGVPKPHQNISGTFMNGHARSASEAQRIRDAEAFELQGLISDEEGDGQDDGPARGPMDPRKAEDEENDPVRWKSKGQH